MSLDSMGNASNEKRLQRIMKLRRDFNNQEILTVRAAMDKYMLSEKTILQYCKEGNIPLWFGKENKSVVEITDENKPKWY